MQIRRAAVAAPPVKRTLLQRAGDRVKFAAEQGALGAGTAVASYVAPFAVTAAISRIFPSWAPMGGVVGNLVIGAGVGAVVGMAIHDKFVGEPRNRREQQDRSNTILHSAAFGAIGGFLGVTASPAAVVDWPALSIFSGTTVATTAGVLGTAGFVHGLWKGPAA